MISIASLSNVIYTIGHSKHRIERFLALLGQHGITAVADVRSTPYSRFNPQFNRKALQQALADAGIEYVFLGKELGARAADPACYENGSVSYAKLAATALFQQGLERLQTGMSAHRIAVMCAEKEPLDCHRTILVTRELGRRGIQAAHILENGELESNASALARLRQRLKLTSANLFATDCFADDEAFDLQARKIAYTRKD
jgi:uncharacterized protein (DUF488 family)